MSTVCNFIIFSRCYFGYETFPSPWSVPAYQVATRFLPLCFGALVHCQSIWAWL